MDANSFLSPVSALDHPVVDNMFNELVAMGPVPGHPLMSTYTSVLQSPKRYDERSRHWFVGSKITVTHFGVKLPNPLEPPAGDSVTLAQATAANKIHEGYLEREGFKYGMLRFYNLGLSRVSTASHLYAMDFCLWMRGYALGAGDFGDKFYYTKPSAHIGPFSAEYDIFYHAKRAERFRESQVASGIVTPSDMSFPIAPGAPHIVDATSTNTGQPPRAENERPNSEITATEEAHPKLTVEAMRGLDMQSPDATITNAKNADLDESLREEREPAPPEVSGPPASNAQPDRAVRKTKRGRKKNRGGATNACANIGQPSTVQQGQASTKHSLDTTDATALAPQPKRQQQGLPLRFLTPVLEEEYLPSQERQQSQIPAAASAPQTPAQAKTSPEFVAKVCGNRDCGKPGHELADCFGPPSNIGDINGCPFCNTQEHVLDNCPLLLTVSKDQLFDVLVTRRANLPLIRTAMSFLNLAASTKKLDVLAKTMPLQRRTARWAYTELKLWKNRDHSKLSRDPEFPSDPRILMGKLYENWETLVTGTTRIDRNIQSIPEGITVFRRRWTHELVPYNAVNYAAKINRQHGPKEELISVQQRHRDMVQERLFGFLKDRYEVQPSSSKKEGVREQEK